MSRTPSIPLPEYVNPPVNEVVISVEFVPLTSLQGPQAGLYWAKIRDRYPNSEVHPIVTSPPDIVGNDIFIQPPPAVQFLQSPVVRTWFLSSDKTRIIQVQNDRFIVNWRQVVGNEVYPRFDSGMLPTFEREFSIFRDFVGEAIGQQIEITHCELSYHNHLVNGRDWNSIEDSMSNFSFFTRREGKYLSELETFNMSGLFRLPDNTGRLNFQILHALRQSDKKQIIQLTIIARNRPSDCSDDGISEWLKGAREWIVLGFTELTTEKAHRRWGRTR